MKQAEHDTKWQETVRVFRQDAEKAKAFKPEFTGAEVLVLLDRIEELENQFNLCKAGYDNYNAERKINWEAARRLRAPIRVALDEWHKLTNHSESAESVHDMLRNAYGDTAGIIT